MADTGLELDTARLRRLADGRFLGQGFDLVVDLPDGPYDGPDAAGARLTAAFETAYREKFALTPPDVPVEFINIRVAVRAPVAGAEVVAADAGTGRRRQGQRPATSPSEGFEETTVYDRARLAPGDAIRAPRWSRRRAPRW